MIDGNILIAALAHYEADHGPVVPVNYNKGTWVSWSKYKEQKQTEEEIREFFSKPVHGLALIAWPYSDFAILDFDGPHAQAAWQATGIELPYTARNRTRSGGVHVIFRIKEHVDGIRRRVRIVRAQCCCTKTCGVDFLVNGIFVVPPTPGYHEDPEAPMDHIEVIPESVLDLARAVASSKGNGRVHGDSDRIREGERNSTLVSLAGSMRRRGMTYGAILVALQTENQTRCHPLLPEREVEGIARSVGRYEPSISSESEHLTDLGNTKRLVTLHGQDLRYCYQISWLVWNGRRWRKDETGEVVRRAKDTIRTIYIEAANCDDEKTRKALASHAKQSESEPRINAMIALAESEPGIPVTVEELDSDPWLLNVLNGTLNLKSGELRPHGRENLITKLISVTYDPGASCAGWDLFLDRIMGTREDLIRFLQKAMGYSLVGDTSEQVLFIFYGTGANGKTTFVNVMTSLLADYAKQTPTDTLLVKRGGAIPNDIARLKGARFVAAVESEGGKRLAETLVKTLTGGDTVTARFLHREFFEFKPTFKIFLAVNHKPRIKGTDHAIWRRIRLIPFTVTIPEEEQDKTLSEKLKGELSGILRWAVEGCLLWQREGLGVPQAVKDATANYREEMDVIADFLADCCEIDPEATATAKELYESYVRWCEQAGEKPMTKKDFGLILTERGYIGDRAPDRERTRFRKGLQLL